MALMENLSRIFGIYPGKNMDDIPVDINAQSVGDIDVNVKNTDNIPVIPEIPSSATQRIATNNASGATTILHTVNSGKTFKLIAAEASVLSVAVSNYTGYMAVRDTGDNWLYNILTLYSNQIGAYSNSICFPVLIEIPSGYDIV